MKRVVPPIESYTIEFCEACCFFNDVDDYPYSCYCSHPKGQGRENGQDYDNVRYIHDEELKNCWIDLDFDPNKDYFPSWCPLEKVEQ